MLCTVLTTTTTEDGGLGFARVEGDKLCLWSVEARPNGGALAMEWTQDRVIDLRSPLPIIDLLGFADGLSMILVGTIDGCFSVDQKSGRIDKLVDGRRHWLLQGYRSLHELLHSRYIEQTINVSLARTIRTSRISVIDRNL